MTVTRKPLSRRAVLRGAGTLVALPMLDAMMPALASAAPVGPARLSIYYMPNGMIMDSFTPAQTGVGYELSPILKQLEPYREKFTVISGLAQANGQPMGDGSGDHARCGGAYLTAEHPKKTEGYDVHVGVSMDQHIANKLGKETQIASLQLGIEPNSLAGSCDTGYSCAYSNTLSWTSPNTPLPSVNNPREVFERLFGDDDRIDQASRLAQFRRNASILDFVMEDAKRMSPNLSVDDHRKMDEYLTSVRDLERRIQMAEKGSGTGAAVSGFVRPAGVPDDMEAHIRMMLDLQVLAMRADMTRISTFMVGRELSQRSYPMLDIADAHHSLSHHGNDPEKIAKLARLNTYLVSFYGYYLGQLQAAKEGDSNLLERTMAWGACGLGDPNRHDHLNLGLVVAGGLTKGGRHIAAKQTPIANVLMTTMEMFGAPQPTIGDSTGYFTDLV
jgi:hypothetical protein